MKNIYEDGTKVKLIKQGNLCVDEFKAMEGDVFTLDVSPLGDITFAGESIFKFGSFTEDYLDENYAIISSVLTKDTLESGMVLEFEGNEKYVLMKDTMYGDYLINANDCSTYFHLDNYNDDLIMKLKNLTLSKESGCFDFMEIYRVWTNVNISVGYAYEPSEMIDRSDNLLWENPTIKPKEMSLADIEEELGYSIKIKETK